MMVPEFRAWYMPFGPKGPMQKMVYGKASSILAFAEMSPDKYIVEQYTKFIVSIQKQSTV